MMNLQLWLETGLNFHRQGNLVQAEQYYNSVLCADQNNVGALHLLGTIRTEQGRIAEAAELFGRALKLNPADFGALNNYGAALMAQDRSEEALQIFNRALTIRADAIQAHYGQGAALAALKHFEEALESFENALALNPRFVPALDNRGSALWNLGRLDAALESLNAALDCEPLHFGALSNRGIVLASMRRFDEALASFDAALAINANVPALLLNRGLALLNLGRHAEALKSVDRGMALGSPSAESLANRGQILWHLRRLDEAVASYERALEIDPGHVRTLINHANAMLQEGKPARALNGYETAVSIEPGNDVALVGMGAALRTMGRSDEALASFDRALSRNPENIDALNHRANVYWADKAEYVPAAADMRAALVIDPSHPYLLGEILHLNMYGADWRDFERLQADIDAGVRTGRRVVRPFVYQAVAQSPAELQACSRIFAQDQYPAAQQFPIPERQREKIRVGYLSGEFREHATAYLTAGLFELHDRTSFEIVAVDSAGGDGSLMRRRLEGAFDGIIDISRMSDLEAANTIRGAGIDILVNLTGYFGKPRMGVFARRPAPIQVNYLGFPATLGAPYIDYIMADPVVIREDEKQFYDEQVVYLPGCYQVNDSKRLIAEAIPTRKACGLPEGVFVFGNFNQSYKLTPPVFAAWMRILRETGNSILWLLESQPPFAENLVREAVRHGVAGERLFFAPRIPVEQHLARLTLVDLFLDTLPYNAHTTASDALWAGVPLVTCEGTTFPGRVAASLLLAAGLPDLAAKTVDEFEVLAITLARDTERLRGIRAELARNRLTCALFDTDLSRRHIEAAYRTMWDIWRGGGRPQSFHVPSSEWLSRQTRSDHANK